MKVRCPHCQKVFNAETEQEKLLSSAIEKGQRLVMLECPECYWNVPVNPGNLLSAEPQKDDQSGKHVQQPRQCPECKDGWMSFVDDGNEKFSGCGECGYTTES